MLTIKVEVGRRGRGGDAFALVAFVRDPAVVTSAIATPVFNVPSVIPSEVNVTFPHTSPKFCKRLGISEFSS
jgi:hypothetical protein